MIGLVWPEPTSSAAGTRMIQLINLFLAERYQVTFASAASKSEFSHELTAMGVIEREIKLNDSSFNILIKEIDPHLVLFDRFMVEEQYGWRVHQECPAALKILDTEDLHSLRNARQQAIKNRDASPQADLYSDLAKREIAAILRSDLSLIISETEMCLLQSVYHIDPSLLHYLPFLEEEITPASIQNWKPYEQRTGFVFIGNFLHEPNWHTLQVLKKEIWPVLRRKFPSAKINIYGAYVSPKVLQLHQEKENFLIHGRAKDAKEAISNHKVLLGPIQFGAGAKGKFIDAMLTGTPTVTTPIGAEAMNGDLPWNGAIADHNDDFIEKAIQLYQDKDLWLQAQKNGIALINIRYGKSKFIPLLIEKIKDLSLALEQHREHNFIGQILQHQTLNSIKYMSLWIEEKNRIK